MDRRRFLRGLVGVQPSSVRPTYFFAPVGGWISPSSVYNSPQVSLTWRHLTPEDIQLDIEEILYKTITKENRIPYTAIGMKIITDALDGVLNSNLAVPYYEISTRPPTEFERINRIAAPITLKVNL